MKTEREHQEVAAQVFADWMHVQGYTNNAAVSPVMAMLMAKAWKAGLLYGMCKALDIYEDLKGE